MRFVSGTAARAPRMMTDMNVEARIEAIQAALREAGHDGWLFYDHHHRDPIAARILGLDEKAHITRRWYYFVPAEGEPRKLMHRIEQGRLDELPGSKALYSSWQELAQGLEAMLGGFRTVAMQYSPNNAIMYVSMVDAGTVEFLRSLGKRIVSSADLVAQFEAVLNEDQRASHAEAQRAIDLILAEGWREMARKLRPSAGRTGELTEYDHVLWLYTSGLQTADGKPNFPPGMSPEALATAAKSYDLAAHPPSIDWPKALMHLPEKDIIAAIGGPHGIFADPTPTGQPGLIERTPNDPAWYKGGLWHDSMRIDIPGLWLMTWYDISTADNLATYNYVRSTASPAVANQQYAIIAPVPHCSYKRAAEHTMVGDRDLGDARLDYDAITFAWFDHFLKGEDNGALEKTPKVRYYTMGSNKWQTSDTWPPANAKPVTYYLASGGSANSLNGDGSLVPAPQPKDTPDQFFYDPLNPVPTHGGGFCCMGPDFKAGAVDQRGMETRNDILVYSTGPLKEGIEVSGPIEVSLYVSSDAKDTDFTVKLIEVLPDGTAYNIDENIQRARYREGYDKPPVWMEKGKVYKLAFQPMQTSIYFAAGHQLRIEVSSSNFPRFDRNLNTGGDNFSETKTVVAHNAVHHSAQFPSSITLSVVSK